MNFFYLILGVTLISVIDAFWRRFQIYKPIDTAIEHYHVGLLLLILGEMFNSDLLYGMGLYCILQESLGDRPYAIGKRHFFTSTLIGVILALILLSRLILRFRGG